MKVILKNITVINPEQKLNKKTNLLIENGVISKIGNLTSDDLKDSNLYDFNDKYCSPGFFDLHVHLREPGREDEETIETGCNAAIVGGFTGVACMPNTEPAIDSAEIINLIKEKSKNNLVDVFPVAAATLGRKGETISPMFELYEAGAVAFSDDGTAIKNARILRTTMEYSKMFNLPIIEHCEDESLANGAMNEGYYSTFLGLPSIPSIAEDLIVSRDLIMAEYLNSKIHIAHISTKKSVELVRQAKAKGLKVTTEVAPHHFTFTDEAMINYNTNLKMSPPLRSKNDLEAIIEGLKDGTIDCIASDHAPHSIEEKEVEFEDAPNGILGLETSFGLASSILLHKKILSIEQLVEKFSINPRKIINLSIPKIEAGQKANLTIFDVNEIWTVDISKFKSKSKNSPYDKRLLTGKTTAVINNHKMYYKDKVIDLK